MPLKDFQQTTALSPHALFLLESATLYTSPGGHEKPKPFGNIENTFDLDDSL